MSEEMILALIGLFMLELTVVGVVYLLTILGGGEDE